MTLTSKRSTNTKSISDKIGAAAGAARRLFRNRKFVVGFVLIVGLVLVAAVISLLKPYNPFERFALNQPPSSAHWLGTDGFGRDVVTQLFTGVLLSLQISVTASIIGTLLGSLVGFVAGYYGGRVDTILRGLTDVFLVIPMLPVLVLISASVTKVDIWTMAVIISLWAWASPARQVRAQTLTLKERDFIFMSKLSGMRSMEIVLTEIMPHMLQWMFANFVNGIVWAMLLESSLEILGLGPQNSPTLGMMVYWSIFREAIYRGLWWWWGGPVVMYILTFTSLVVMHSGLDDILNPRLRKGGE